MPNLQSSTTVSSTNNSLRVVDIVEGTSVDGPGLRTAVYFAGCAHRCPGCHNESTWPFDAGSDRSLADLMDVIRYNGFDVTFTGGDPVYQAEALLPLAKAIRAEGLGIWCYTGFLYEEVVADVVPRARRLLDFVDVLVDGPYMAALRNADLLFRGSSNQRLVDVAASLSAGTVKLYDADPIPHW